MLSLVLPPETLPGSHSECWEKIPSYLHASGRERGNLTILKYAENSVLLNKACLRRN